MAVVGSGFLKTSDREAVRQAVQRNCDIADARYAGNFTLCTYLLKMRELYRWESRQPFGQRLPSDEVGPWVERRERYWDTLENADFECLPVGGACNDPFEAATVNRHLLPRGLVYSAGYGRGGRPTFFLGVLERCEDFDDYTILISGEELARDLAAAPAMSQGNTIFVRRDSIRRMLFETMEAWHWRDSPQDALARALDAYGWRDGDEGALERMTDGEIEAAVWHEVGEVMAGRLLGPQWEQTVMEVAGSRQEWVARAVRDHLADCLITLPALLESGPAGALHFYFANLTGLRRELFPQLTQAYQRWVDDASSKPLQRLVAPAREHWLRLAQRLLDEPADRWPVGDDALATLRPAL